MVSKSKIGSVSWTLENRDRAIADEIGADITSADSQNYKRFVSLKIYITADETLLTD